MQSHHDHYHHHYNQYSNAIPADVRPYDILCGRSKTCFNNIGNRRFRITISMNLRKFDSLKGRIERGNFIATLARTLKEDAGFRFIRISRKSGRVELSDDEIRAKIGHALRDLSKAQAEAAAGAGKPTEEAKKIIEAHTVVTSAVASASPSACASTDLESPLQQPHQEPPSSSIEMKDDDDDEKKPASSASPHTVTPQLPKRQIVSPNNLVAAIHAKEEEEENEFLNHPYNDEDDISDISDENQDDAVVIPNHRQHPPYGAQHLQTTAILSPSTTREVEEQPRMKMPPLVPSVEHKASTNKPAPDTPILAKHPASQVGDDDYCLMPLRFDDDRHGMLDPVPMDLFASDASTNNSADLHSLSSSPRRFHATTTYARRSGAAAKMPQDDFDLHYHHYGNNSHEDIIADVPYSKFRRRCSLY